MTRQHAHKVNIVMCKRQSCLVLLIWGNKTIAKKNKAVKVLLEQKKEKEPKLERFS